MSISTTGGTDVTVIYPIKASTKPHNNYTISEKKIGNLYSNVDNAYMDMRVALTTFVTKLPKADRDVIYDILLKGNFATANAAINTFKKKVK